MSSIKLKGSTSGDITISAPAEAGTNTLTLPAQTGIVPISDVEFITQRKTATPIFINGDMGIWQRGTALASASGTYACDRFWYAGTGATSQRSTEVPSGFVYSNKLTYGSSDMSIGQPIELPATGKQGIFIAGQTVTIAFYGKVDSGTEGITVNINARNEKFSGTNSTSFTISDNAVTLTTDWQRFTKTFTIPTINANNVMIAFELGGIGKTAYFTGFQCELGTYDSNSIPDFQFEDVATSLARCQRYFVTTYNEGVVPGTNGSKHGAIFVYRQRDNNYAGFNFQFPVGMRTIPAQVRYSLDGTSGQATASTTNFTSSTNHAINGTSSVIAYGTGTAADDCYQHFTCDAEL